MFVERDQTGKIKGAFNRPQYVGQEEVANDAAELTAFLNSTTRHRTNLAAATAHTVKRLLKKGEVAKALEIERR